MKTYFNNNFNFRKTYIGKATIKTTDNSTQEVRLVEYDPYNKQDKKFISSLKKTWGDKAKLAENIADSFEYAGNTKIKNGNPIINDNNSVKYRFLGFEDKTGNTLVITGTCEHKDYNELEIDFIQTNPKEMYGSNERKYKGLGAALVGQIVEIAKSKEKESIVVLSENDGFWCNSTFFEKEEGSENAMLLSRSNYDKFIEYVRKLINS